MQPPHRQILQPRNAQPPIRTGSSLGKPRFFSRAKIAGSATSATMAREAQAPAQKCGPAPKAMLFEASRRTSNCSARSKCFSSRLAGAEHQEHAFVRFRTRRRGCVHGFAIRRGDMPIGEIQRAYSSNACSQVILPLAHELELIGMGQQRPDRAGDRLARLVLAAARSRA